VLGSGAAGAERLTPLAEAARTVYFRVQGPAVWIEYAPQGGTDHIHTVIRNPNDGYGAALVKR
jgi:hypothetical protein